MLGRDDAGHTASGGIIPPSCPQPDAGRATVPRWEEGGQEPFQQRFGAEHSENKVQATGSTTEDTRSGCLCGEWNR